MAKTERTLENLLSIYKIQQKLADMTSLEPCPDESQLSIYMEGRCNPKDEKSLQSHLADCVICRETLIACTTSRAPKTNDDLLSSTSNSLNVLEEELRMMESSLNPGNNVRQDKTPSTSVMVVDDDPIYLRSLIDALSDEFEVAAFSDGKAALCGAHRRHFQAIVMDIKMAGLNGLEVAQRLKSDRVSSPIIFNTGFPGEFFREDIEKHYRPFGYVTKDNPAELLSLIHQATAWQTHA